MGLAYALQLAFPRERAADVLRAVAAFADPVGACHVTLPGGERLALPFTSRLPSGEERGEVTVELGVWTTFDAALWLPVDGAGAWRDYLSADDGVRTRDGAGGREVAVGYISLTIGLGARYGLFSFGAVTSRMSRLFAESEAVQRRFADLLRANGGLRGLLDLEWGGHYPLLADPGASIILDEAMIRAAGPDTWVEAALAAPVQRGGAPG